MRPDAGQDELSDQEYFRQLNNGRKTRSRNFLKGAKTRYHLLTTLTLSSICAQVTGAMSLRCNCCKAAKPREPESR